MRAAPPVAVLAALAIGGAWALALGVSSEEAPVWFESPSGNIRCLIAEGTGKADARCVTLQPRQAAQVVEGERARHLAFGRVGPLAPAEALPYGTSVFSAGLLCNSRTAGISCVDTSTGKGFRIAREGVVLFPKPAEAPPVSRPTAPVVSPSSSCDPNYSGACVPAYPPDVNCPQIGATVRVTGTDVHHLDRDRDGYGCDP